MLTVCTVSLSSESCGKAQRPGRAELILNVLYISKRKHGTINVLLLYLSSCLLLRDQNVRANIVLEICCL